MIESMVMMLWLLLVQAKPQSSEERAIAYLAREVPRWAAANKCYSCHNNGDAARALYLSTRLKHDVPTGALADTSKWLTQPDRWDSNGGKGPFSDKKLARIQFAATLRVALDAGAIRDRARLQRAAELLVEVQDQNGSWSIENGDIGSPATHGTTLATVIARRTLEEADARKFADPIKNADHWLRGRETKSVIEAGALLHWAKDKDIHPEWFDLLRKGQSRNGGWGPYVNSPPEPFDTSVVLLGLVRHRTRPGVAELIEPGRTYLIDTQKEDGSWPETTRPAGAESYAQRLSTTGWALQALLKTH